MCGICGIMLEDCGCYNDFPIGSILYKMMESQQIRVKETGIAIFNKKSDHGFYGLEYFKKENGKYNRFCETVYPERLNTVLYDLNQNPNVIISACTQQMSLIKDIGLGQSRYKI